MEFFIMSLLQSEVMMSSNRGCCVDLTRWNAEVRNTKYICLSG